MQEGKSIIVLATATRTSGSYMIYKQFISYLATYKKDNRYFIFVDPNMDQPKIEGVEYIHETDHSWRRRFFMDNKGFQDILDRKGICANLIVSFQNTAMVTDLPQILYYHTSLSFYPNKWNPFLASERVMFLYKHIFPFFVRRTLNKHTHVVTQIPFIKKAFMKQHKWPEDRMHVMFPDLESINIDTYPAEPFSPNEFHFIYPATPFPFKEHKTIIEAINLLMIQKSDIANRIRVHFTITRENAPHVALLVDKYRLQNLVIFENVIKHDRLMSMYKSSCALLYPSTIETLGLPQIEAAKFGLPIVATDLEYSKEVLSGYEGVVHINSFDYQAWADEIEKICLNKPHYSPIEDKESTWPAFYKLIDKLVL